MLRRILQLYREAFAGLPRDVWRLGWVTLVYRSGTMVVPFLILYFTGPLGLSPRQAGGLLALYGLGALGGALIAGRLSDRIGPHYTQITALVAGGLAFFTLGAVRYLPALPILVVCTGAMVEGFRPANAAAIAFYSEGFSRIQAFGLRRLAINLGVSLGPAIGGFLAAHGYGWLFLVNGCASLAAAALLALWLPPIPASTTAPPEAGEDGKQPAASPWQDRPFVLLLILASLMTVVFFQVLSTYSLTLYDAYGYPEKIIGLVLAVNTLIIVLLEMVLLRAVRAVHPLRVVAWGTLLIGAGLGWLAVSPLLPSIIFSVLLWTTGEMLTFPLLESFVAERAPAHLRGRYLGLYTSTFSVAFVAAPLIGPAIYQTWGYRVLWITCALAGIALWIAFLQVARRTAVP